VSRRRLSSLCSLCPLRTAAEPPLGHTLGCTVDLGCWEWEDHSSHLSSEDIHQFDLYR
jgi:hypothetical protein